MNFRWILSPQAADVDAIAQRWNVDSIVAQILVSRGMQEDETVQSFLFPQMKDLHPPSLLPGVITAVGIIADAVREKKRIILYGDYDVDGVSGIAIMWHMLDLLGANVGWYVPHRIEEGYGLNVEAAERLITDGAELIITIDCGVSAVAESRRIRERGCLLILTDHHTLPEKLPMADAIVHPLVGGVYPNSDICAAGIAYKLAWALAVEFSGSQRVSPPLRELLLELLPLAALGTLADVVSLRGENRVIARHGLVRLAQSRLPGLRALHESSGSGRTKVSCTDVGFRIAPRINAAGRMGHARLAVELLTTADAARAREIAMYLDDQNRTRQAVERRVSLEAQACVLRDRLASDARRAIVVAGDDWHPGVLGIVAARLVEKHHRPAIVISRRQGEGHGSGRSVKHFHMANALSTCSPYLKSQGGHAMAAGLRIDVALIPEFTEAFIALANSALTGVDLQPQLRLDGEICLSSLSMEATQAIENLGPFGMGNPHPKLASRWVRLADEPRVVGKGDEHLQISLWEEGSSVRGIGFGLGPMAEDLKQHRICRVAFEPRISQFQNRKSVELRILDLQLPDGIDRNPG